MNGPPDIPTLLQMSLSINQQERELATEQLIQIINNPSSIETFMQLFQNEQNIQNKNTYLIYIDKILYAHWVNYNPEQQNILLQDFIAIAQNTEDPKIIYALANIFSRIYSVSRQNSIADIVLQSNNFEFISQWFARSGNDLPDDYITCHIQQFIEIGQWGFSQPNFSHFSISAKIFMIIIQFTQDVQIFSPICQYIIESLPNEPNFVDDDLKNSYWALVDELFHKKILPIDLFGQFLQALSQSSIASEAINWFSDIIPLLSKEQLVQFLDLDIKLLTTKIANDSTLPEDSFEIVYNAISDGCQRCLVFDFIRQLISGDAAQQCTGIYLLIPFVQASPVTAAEEVNFILGCLKNALESPSQPFQEAAFRVIDSFEGSSTELVSVFPPLIELTSHYLSSSNQVICSLAYASLITLLKECDNEIGGLLGVVWGLLAGNQVSELMMTSFMEVISLLIKRTESLDDDIVDSILEWLETVFNPQNPPDISIRSGALSIIAELVTNEESMCDSLIPLCQQTVAEAFATGNQEAIMNACCYLQTIAYSFKARSVPIISPFVSNLGGALQSENYRTIAAFTAAVYTGYSGDNTLLPSLCPIISALLVSEDLQDQDCACSSLTGLSRVLSDNPISFTFYEQVVKIILEESDQELLLTAFKAAKSLFKRCRNSAIQQFTSLTFAFLDQLMSGNAGFLDHQPPVNNPKMDPFIQGTMEFFGVFFKSNPQNVTPICNSLIEWMSKTNETNAFSITGALMDALEFCQVEESVPIQMCIYVQANAKSIKDPDLQQNISYFLALLCRRYPNQIGLVQQVLPFVVNWWSRALSKKTGYQEVLSNIASFFLSYVLIDSSLPENLVIGALQQFPPIDLLETETMCLSMINLMEKNIASINVLVEVALAFSRLFIESQSQLESRKIPQEVFQKSIQVFKQLMQNQDIQQNVFSRYDKRKAKKQQLINLISQ